MKIPFKNKIIKIKSSLERRIMKMISSNRFSISLYYFLRPKTYLFEKSIVIRANLKHMDYSNFEDAHVYQLRRNIHRIEKGLSQKNLKNIFATNYIEETITIYEGYSKSHHKDPDELKYFNLILDEYFEIVEKTGFLTKLFGRYSEAKSSIIFPRTKEVDLLNQGLHKDHNEFSDIVKKRHSIRFFTEDLVPNELVNNAINIARNAPSGCNRQPYKYFVLASPERAIEVANISFGTTGFENLKQIIAVVIDHEAYFKEFDRHLGIIDASLSAMLLMLALTTEGVSTCPINWPDIPEKQKAISKAIKLKANEQVVMLIAYGYAQEEVRIPLSTKKSTKQLSQFI